MLRMKFCSFLFVFSLVNRLTKWRDPKHVPPSVRRIVTHTQHTHHTSRSKYLVLLQGVISMRRVYIALRWYIHYKVGPWCAARPCPLLVPGFWRHGSDVASLSPTITNHFSHIWMNRLGQYQSQQYLLIFLLSVLNSVYRQPCKEHGFLPIITNSFRRLHHRGHFGCHTRAVSI